MNCLGISDLGASKSFGTPPLTGGPMIVGQHVSEAVLIAEKPHDSSHLGSVWLKSEVRRSGSILNFKSEMIL